MSRPRRAATLVWRVLSSLPGRILVSVLMLAAVAASIDWATLERTLSGASWGLFAVSVALIFASFVVGAVRWRVLLLASRLRTALLAAFRAYMVGAFANNFLPTGFGGDAVRAWIAGGRPGFVRALASVGVDRLSALACGLLAAWLAVLADPGSIPLPLVVLLAVASLAAIGLVLLARVLARRPTAARLVPEPVRGPVREVVATIRGYQGDTALLVKVVGLGLVFQGMTVAALWSIAASLDLEVGPAVIAVVTPLVLLATLAPISLAGFGIREAAFAALLAPVGVSTADATLLSLLSVASMAIASLPGAVMLALRPAPERVPPDRRPVRPPENHTTA